MDADTTLTDKLQHEPPSASFEHGPSERSAVPVVDGLGGKQTTNFVVATALISYAHHTSVADDST